MKNESIIFCSNCFFLIAVIVLLSLILSSCTTAGIDPLVNPDGFVNAAITDTVRAITGEKLLNPKSDKAAKAKVVLTKLDNYLEAFDGDELNVTIAFNAVKGKIPDVSDVAIDFIKNEVIAQFGENIKANELIGLLKRYVKGVLKRLS